MGKININSIIKRNKLLEYSGEYFRGDDSEIVKRLIREGKRAFLGIQDDSDKYTIIGEDFVHYNFRYNTGQEISNIMFLEAYTTNMLSKGKSFTHEFIELEDGKKIWILNTSTMHAIVNTVLIISNMRQK